MAKKDFSHQQLEGTDFTGVNLAGALMRYADLRNANLNVAHIEEADLAYANLENASLGHLADVEVMGFSPTGRLLVTIDRLGQLKAWDHIQVKEVTSLGFPRHITTFSFVYSSDRIVFGTKLGELLFADLNDVNRLQELPPPNSQNEAAVTCISAASGSSLIAAGRSDKTIDLRHGTEPLYLLSGHTDVILSLQFTPDGRLLVSSDDGGRILFWSTSTGELLRTITAHKGKVPAICIAAGGELLASGGWDKTVRIWELASGKLIREITTNGYDVNPVAFVPRNADLVAAGVEDNTVRFWSLATGRQTHALTLPHGYTRALAFTPDGEALATATGINGAGEVQIWKTSSGQQVASIRQELHCLRTNLFRARGLRDDQRSLLLRRGAVEVDPDILTQTGEPLGRFVRRQQLEEFALTLAERHARSSGPTILIIGPGTFMPTDPDGEAEGWMRSLGLPDRDRGEALYQDPSMLNDHFDHLYWRAVRGRRSALIARLGRGKRPGQPEAGRPDYEALISLVNQGVFSLAVDADIFSRLSPSMFNREHLREKYEERDDVVLRLRQLWGRWGDPGESRAYLRLFPEFERQTHETLSRDELDVSRVTRLVDELMAALRRSSRDAVLLWTGFWPRHALWGFPFEGEARRLTTYWCVDERMRGSAETAGVATRWLDYRVGRFSKVFSDLYRLMGSTSLTEAAGTTFYEIIELLNSEEVGDRMQAAQFIVAYLIESRRRPWEHNRVLDLITQLGGDESSEVRRALMVALLRSYWEIPHRIRYAVSRFSEDGDDGVRGDLAVWILVNYERARGEFEPILFNLAQDRSGYVRRSIVDTVRSRFRHRQEITA